MPREPEPIRDPALMVPLKVLEIFLQKPEERKPPIIVVDSYDTKDSFVFEPPDSAHGAIKPPSNQSELQV